jgi:hypothetical protein
MHKNCRLKKESGKYCLRNIIDSESKGIKTINLCKGLQFSPDHIKPNFTSLELQIFLS